MRSGDTVWDRGRGRGAPSCAPAGFAMLPRLLSYNTMSLAIDLVSFVSEEPPRSRLQNVLHHFKMHAGLSSRMVLELSRCPLWIISGHCSSLHDLCFTTESRYQLSALGCPLSANKSWMTKSAWPLMCRWNKHVADTAYGANGIGVSRVKFYLSAQTCNP